MKKMFCQKIFKKIYKNYGTNSLTNFNLNNLRLLNKISKSFSINNSLRTEILDFIGTKNLAQLNIPSTKELPDGQILIKRSGENSLVLDNSTYIDLKSQTFLKDLFNNWIEAYMVLLKAFDKKIGSLDKTDEEKEEIIEEVNLEEVENELKKNFEQMTIEDLELIIENVF